MIEIHKDGSSAYVVTENGSARGWAVYSQKRRLWRVATPRGDLSHYRSRADALEALTAPRPRRP